jgi:hypothetical protein
MYVTKVMFFGGALGLIVVAALRFTTIGTQTVHQAILNFYYLFFGVVLVLTQLHFHRVVDLFRFLNYYWGKCVFCFFLASLAFSN